MGPSSLLLCFRVLSVWEGEGGAKPTTPAAPHGGHWDMEKMDLDDAVLRKHILGPSVVGFGFVPFEPARFLVQASDGRLLHRSRFGATTPPQTFGVVQRSPMGDHGGDARIADGMDGESKKRKAGKKRASAGPVTTCLDFSPHNEGFFLAGCADGSVRLYQHTISRPLRTWETSSRVSGPEDVFFAPPPIVQLKWSPSRPAVFFALDGAANMHVFDLATSGAGPVASLDLGAPISDRRGGGHSEGTQRTRPQQQSRCTSFGVGHYPSCPSYLAVTTGGDDGVKYTTVTESFASPQRSDEAEFMSSYLGRIL